MRDRARAVVVGGGVGGCSVLYWLTRLGWDDVVLVERAELTSGSTFHSAGLVGQRRSTLSLTRMMMESVDLYRSLETEVGLETGWQEVGSLRLASSQERMEEIARQAGWAKTFGLPLELVSPSEAAELFPPMTTEGVLGAAFLPTDGYVDPSQLTLALAEGARRRGAEVATGTRLTGVVVERNRVARVETDRGPIEAEVVVNAGGMYARELGALAGVNVPIIPMAHEYLVTKPAGLPLDMPTMRDPSLLVYFRPESGGLVMGGYERHCAPWGLEGIPADFNSRLLDEDWPRFEELMENALVRVPSLGEMEVVRLINGPEAFTPDGEFILGPSDVRGFWVASGFCAHGLAGAGGMGKLVAEWIVEGTPSLDVWHMDSRRFGLAYRSREYTLARTKEIYETYYDVKYPGHERSAGRPLRVSAAYSRLQDLGAVFGEKSGWERANWFETNETRGDESLRPRGWAGKLWSAAIGAEHVACRETAAVFDESSFAKILVSGDGAAELLERLCANRVARGVGQITYAQMLNPHGGIECDFTVTRLAVDRFRIVTGTAVGQHDLAWIRQHAPDDGSVQVVDESSQYACLGISNESFPYMHARELAVGRVPCLALRVTYVGELGWELHCPADLGLALWDTIWEAGLGHGLVAGGYKAIDSLRLEKGYRVWGADITPEDTPFEAGLGFAVKLDKDDFVGRDALLAAGDPQRVLRCLTLDDPRAVALGSEPVRVGGELVGRVTSGGYGYSIERSIAYAYVPAQHEINFRFADALTMADNHVISKNGAKEIASANGCSITFMAKPYESWIGNSCHIHASLFRGEEPAFEHDDELFDRFLAGMIGCFEELAVFLAPTINSYKRYAAGSWAPTTLAWGYDNRTCGFRIVGHGASRRVETRIPGGDVNPYLAFAAMIAAGLYGIENELPLAPALEGNAYESDAERFPSTLREAIAALESGSMARAAFGDQVVDHYLNYAQTEQSLFDKVVTDWERKRLFERG